MKKVFTRVRVPNLTNLTQLLKTNLTFLVVLQFEICLHLDNFSSSFLFQKCNLGFENVNFENNDSCCGARVLEHRKETEWSRLQSRSLRKARDYGGCKCCSSGGSDYALPLLLGALALAAFFLNMVCAMVYHRCVDHKFKSFAIIQPQIN